MRWIWRWPTQSNLADSFSINAPNGDHLVAPPGCQGLHAHPFAAAGAVNEPPFSAVNARVQTARAIAGAKDHYIAWARLLFGNRLPRTGLIGRNARHAYSMLLVGPPDQSRAVKSLLWRSGAGSIFFADLGIGGAHDFICMDCLGRRSRRAGVKRTARHAPYKSCNNGPQHAASGTCQKHRLPLPCAGAPNIFVHPRSRVESPISRPSAMCKPSSLTARARLHK